MKDRRSKSRPTAGLILSFGVRVNGKQGEIFVRVANTANGFRIGIQDDGVGLSPNVHEGALGLSLMRSFASQLGGHLAVSSAEGTSIQLTLYEDGSDSEGQAIQGGAT